MKTLAILLIAISTLLSGCVVYPERDRDRDGVPNSQDRRPNDPYRY